MYFSGIINIPAWNKAGWKGMAFGFFPDKALPFLGPAFEDRQSAETIFSEWQRNIGDHDDREQIRWQLGSDRTKLLNVSMLDSVHGCFPGLKPHFRRRNEYCKRTGSPEASCHPPRTLPQSGRAPPFPGSPGCCSQNQHYPPRRPPSNPDDGFVHPRRSPYAACEG